MTPVPQQPFPPPPPYPGYGALPPPPPYPDYSALPPPPPPYGDQGEPPVGGYAVPPSSGGYVTLPQYGGFAAGYSDPLVLPPNSSLGAWFSKVQEISRRSWKAALIIVGLGIAVPNAIVNLIQSITEVGALFGATAITKPGNSSAELGSILIGSLVTLVFSVAAIFVAAAGWAAGTWALTREAATGQPANIGEAFRFGFGRALSLGLWSILVGLMVVVGLCACLIGSPYLAFATSMFGFVAVFERGQNPIGRSFKLTHANFGPTLGRFAILLVVFIGYTLILGTIIGAIGAAIALGTSGSLASNVFLGVLGAIESLLTTPVYALFLVGLLPTYAELRAREAPLSTAQLNYELTA